MSDAVKSHGYKPAGFVRNTLTLVMGRSIAQLITLIGIPFITRIFDPSAFGEFSIYLSVVTLISSFASMRYLMAVQLPVHEEDAAAVTYVAVLLAAVVALAVPVLLAFLPLPGEYRIGGYLLYAVGASVLLGAIKASLDAYFIRRRLFAPMSYSYVIGAVADRSASIGFGLVLGGITPGLVAGKIIGQLFLIAGMLNRDGLRLLHELISMFSLANTVRAMRRYSGFARYAWLGLLQQVNIQAPVLIIGLLFSMSAAGYYGLAFRVLSLPMQLIGDSLSRSFYQRASHGYRNGAEIGSISLRLLRGMVALIYLPMCVFAVNAPYVFGAFFGSAWDRAGYYAIVMVPMLISGFLSRPVSMLFDLYERHSLLARFDLFLACMVLLSLFGGAWAENDLLAVAAYSMFWVLVDMLKVMTVAHMAGYSRYAVLRLLAGATAASAAVCVPLWYLGAAGILHPFGVALVSMGVLLVYWLFVIVKSPALRSVLRLPDRWRGGVRPRRPDNTGNSDAEGDGMNGVRRNSESV